MTPCKHCWHSDDTQKGEKCCNCGIIATEGRGRVLAVAKPRTQKAQGLQALLTAAKNAGLSVPQPILLFQEEEDMANADVLFLHPPAGGWFARPCPLRPRPGFVESRSVHSERALLNVWKETREADTKGEVLLMPRIDAEWNIAATPGLMAVGPGHDGATAGKASLAFPLTGSLPPAFEKIKQAAGIEPTAACHLEAVIEARPANPPYGYAPPAKVYIVQARAGVAHPGGKDYIPKAVTVAEVVIPCDDLLEWEAKAKALDGKDGIVVYGKGHTLASHAALHCLAHSIPFVTSFQPEVGTKLEPVGAEGPDVQSLVEGIGWGLNVNLTQPNLRVSSMMILYGLHFAPVLTGEYAFWLGAAGAAMLRMGLACGNGECTTQAPGSPVSGQGYQPPSLIQNADSLEAMLEFLPKMESGFFLNGMSTGWQPQMSGIGGWNWGRCVYSLFALNRALHDVVVKWERCEDVTGAYKALVGALNKAVDQAHNGTWWLNRYGVHPQDFAHATAGGWECAFEAAPLLYKVQKARTTEPAAFTRSVLPLATRYVRWEVPTPDPFKCKAKINSEGDLVVTFDRRREDLAPRIPRIACQPGEKVTVHRAFKGTKQVLKFTVARGDGEEVIYTFSVELEKDTRELDYHKAAA